MKITASVQRVNLYRALTGDVRPDIGWLGRPYGTFDNIPLLENPKLEKGRGINLDSSQMAQILNWNPDSGGYTTRQKLAWLTSNEGRTDMVLAYDEATGIYRQHTPEVSGGALVNVLSVEGNYARVQCWDVSNPLPEYLPPHLIYTWRGLTGGGSSYVPAGGVRFPVLYWRAWAYLPMDWLARV